MDRLGAGYASDGRARVIYCPPGIYSIRDAGTVWRSGVSLIGAGPAATRFMLSNEGNRADPTPLAFWTTVQHGADRDRHIADCTFSDFQIDGSGVAMAEYNYLAKGLGLQYVVRGVFRNLYIHHTAATGLGCDFLQDSLIDGVVVVGCGRLDNGEQMGGAGIGIGIGGWGTVERLTIANCTALANGTNGIFLELQKDYWPPPRGYRIIGCHSQGNRFGISDWGADGLIVSACTMTGNLEAGFDVSAQGTSSVAGRGGLLTDCVIDGNMRDGISIGNSPGPYTVRGNRISGNGRHGYHSHDLGRGYRGSIRDVVIESNEFWGNGLDAIRIDHQMTDAVLLNNRIRNNGRQYARGHRRYRRRRPLQRAVPGGPVGQLAARRAPGQGAAGRDGRGHGGLQHRRRTHPRPGPPGRVHRVERGRAAAGMRIRAGRRAAAAGRHHHRRAVRLGDHPGQPDLGQPRQPDPDARAVDHRAGQLRGLPGRGQRPGRQRRRGDATGHPAGGRTVAGQPRGQRLELTGRRRRTPRRFRPGVERRAAATGSLRPPPLSWLN